MHLALLHQRMCGRSEGHLTDSSACAVMLQAAVPHSAHEPFPCWQWHVPQSLHWVFQRPCWQWPVSHSAHWPFPPVAQYSLKALALAPGAPGVLWSIYSPLGLGRGLGRGPHNRWALGDRAFPRGPALGVPEHCRGPVWPAGVPLPWGPSICLGICFLGVSICSWAYICFPQKSGQRR